MPRFNAITCVCGESLTLDYSNAPQELIGRYLYYVWTCKHCGQRWQKETAPAKTIEEVDGRLKY